MADIGATLDLADRTREADDPHSPVVRFGLDKPLRLDAASISLLSRSPIRPTARLTLSAATPFLSAMRSPAISMPSTIIR